MSESSIQNSETQIYLGVDGGQSHTEAVVADAQGNLLGRGTGGASNHAEIPGGRERLENAIKDSVGNALRAANLPAISDLVFASAHCGMTGGAIYKEEIISRIILSGNLVVGHDAPTALFGATAGTPGIIVIAGTGSIVFGFNEAGETARAGGLGFLFSDEGSGFWLATQMIRLAIKEQDNLIESGGILEMVLEFYGHDKIHDVTDDFYNGKLTRDEIAALAKRAHEIAAKGNQAIREQIIYGVNVLTESVRQVARKLNFQVNFPVAGIGGMFRAPMMNEYFGTALAENVPLAEFTAPRFGPAIGALLMSYRQAGVEISENLLSNLKKSPHGNE